MYIFNNLLTTTIKSQGAWQQASYLQKLFLYYIKYVQVLLISNLNVLVIVPFWFSADDM